MVTKADIADVFVFDGTEGIVFPVAPDPSSWPRIHEAWDGFMRCVTESEAPPLTDRDTRLRDDPEWLEAAAAYLELKTAYDELSAKYDAAKERLIAQASHAKEQGGGVSVTRYWKTRERSTTRRSRSSRGSTSSCTAGPGGRRYVF